MVHQMELYMIILSRAWILKEQTRDRLFGFQDNSLESMFQYDHFYHLVNIVNYIFLTSILIHHVDSQVPLDITWATTTQYHIILIQQLMLLV